MFGWFKLIFFVLVSSISPSSVITTSVLRSLLISFRYCTPMFFFSIQWTLTKRIHQVYSGAHGRTMIFTATKADANELCMNNILKQDAQAMHGDIAQNQVSLQLFNRKKNTFSSPFPVENANVISLWCFILQREMVLKNFREGKFKCLVSTDVAARFICLLIS